MCLTIRSIFVILFHRRQRRWNDGKKTSNSRITSVVGIVYEFNQSIHTQYTQAIWSILLENIYIYNQHVWHICGCAATSHNGADECIEYLWRILYSRLEHAGGGHLKKNSLHRCSNTHSVHWWINYTYTSTHASNTQNGILKRWTPQHGSECKTKQFSIKCLPFGLRFAVHSLSACLGSQLNFLCWKLGKYFKHSMPINHIHHSTYTHLCTHRIRVSVARSCIEFSIERTRERAKNRFLLVIII